MAQLTDDQWLQLLLVGGPILSLIGTWMSLKTYSRLKAKKQGVGEMGVPEESTVSCQKQMHSARDTQA